MILFFSLISFSLSASAAQTVRLEDVLRLAQAKSEDIKAVELSAEAARAEIRARDIVLATVVTSQMSQEWDARDTFSPVARGFSRLFDLSFSKLLPTGTRVTFRTGYEQFRLRLQRPRGDRVADWEVSIAQNLWQDFFGRATSYRRERDLAELKGRFYGLVFQRQQFLVDVEGLYWDWALALRELEIRSENLQRSQNIERWVRGRLRVSAADPTELLQAQALVNQRELQLQALRNRLESAWIAFKQSLPDMGHWSDWSPDLKELETHRSPRGLVVGKAVAVEPERLDSLAGRYNATAAERRSDMERESAKPNLQLVYTHGNNDIGNDNEEVWRNAYTAYQPLNRVAVVFSSPLDFELLGEQQKAARLNAEAEKLRSARLLRQSQVQWADLKRETEALAEQVETATRLAATQMRKAEEERKRYSQGRSTAFQAITFEVEAAEAQLEVVRLQVQLRKAEARARLFTHEELSVL